MRNIFFITFLIFLSACGVDKKEIEEVQRMGESWTNEYIFPLYGQNEIAKIENLNIDEVISEKMFEKIKYNEDSVSSLYLRLMNASTEIEKIHIEHKPKSISYGASHEEVWYNDSKNSRTLSIIKSSMDGLSKLDNKKPEYFYIQRIRIEYKDPYQNENGEIYIQPSDIINVILDENKNVLNSRIEEYKEAFDSPDGNKYEFIRYRNIK